MLFYCILKKEQEVPQNFSLIQETPRLTRPGRFALKF